MPGLNLLASTARAPGDGVCTGLGAWSGHWLGSTFPAGTTGRRTLQLTVDLPAVPDRLLTRELLELLAAWPVSHGAHHDLVTPADPTTGERRGRLHSNS